MWRRLFGARAKYGLTTDEIEQFRRQGFLGPFTAFTPREMTKYRTVICEQVLTTPSPHTSYITQLRHLDSRSVWELCSAPPVVDRMASLYGPDLLLWYSNLFDKSPVRREHEGEYPWHQDKWHWKLEPMVSLSAWLAITPSTVENGCVEVIPGSHKREIPTVQVNDARYASWFGGMVADPRCFNEADKVPLVMEPGQFFLFNEGTLHHSNPNRTRERRIGLSFRVTLPMVKTYRPTPCVVLRGRDRMGFNALTESPHGEPALLGVEALPDAEDFTFDQPMHGSGWHLPERDGDAWFCWMGPETTSWLDLRVNGQGERVLRCHILHALEPRALETSKARVNDRPVPLTWGSHGRFVAVEGKVAGEALEAEQGRARVSFQIADVVRPCDLTPGSTDTRELGLAISWLGLRPAGRAA